MAKRTARQRARERTIRNLRAKTAGNEVQSDAVAPRLTYRCERDHVFEAAAQGFIGMAPGSVMTAKFTDVSIEGFEGAACPTCGSTRLNVVDGLYTLRGVLSAANEEGWSAERLADELDKVEPRLARFTQWLRDNPWFTQVATAAVLGPIVITLLTVLTRAPTLTPEQIDEHIRQQLRNTTVATELAPSPATTDSIPATPPRPSSPNPETPTTKPG